MGMGMSRFVASGKVSGTRFLFITLLPALFISGCGRYPIKADNFLTAPIHIEMPTTDGALVKSSDKLTADVLAGLESLTVDELGRSKAAEFITEQYAAEFIDKKVDSHTRIEAALRKSVSDTGEFMKLRVAPGYSPNSSLEGLSVRWTGDDGVATFKVKSNAFNAGFVQYGTTVVTMNLKQHTDDRIINVDISSISYVINCVYGRNTTCIFEDVNLNQNNLGYLLRNTSSIPAKTPTVGDFQNKVKAYLKNRFVKRHNSSEKVEKIYHLDFATAKSRLQRAMGAFKYDGDKSAFILDERYDNPVSINNSKAVHNFDISLYPDKNDTVIQFSGNYDYFEDTFGGADRFGRDSYDKEINGYVVSVTKLLNK